MPMFNRYAWRGAALALAGVVFTALAALLPVSQQIDLALGDALARLTAPSVDLRDSVVVDVDEESMRLLAPQLGAWPYDRDVYALVNRYLLDAGAAVVTYDILFSEARRGDDAFAATLNQKVVLAAVALPQNGVARDAAYQRRLAAAAWAGAADWPAQAWDDMTLPLEIFSARAQTGVISVLPDADGVLRSVPLLHRIQGQVLPSAALAGLRAAGVTVQTDPAGGSVTAGATRLPVDQAGRVRLRYPNEFRGLRVLPFYQVALAASGARQYAQMGASLRGKLVHVGSSSAVLGDFIQSPVGRMAGVFLVGLLPAMLKDGLVLTPRHWFSDGILMLAVLALALAAAHPRAQNLVWVQVLALPVLLLAVAAAVTGLNAAGRGSAVLLPALLGTFIHLSAVFWRQVHLFRKSQQLLLEKLAAEDAARLKSQFLSHMTHELRTPLTAIMGFNNINWHSDDLGRAQRTGNSEVIDRNGRHLMALINNILDQAKLEAGQVRIMMQPEAVRAVVDDVVASLQPLVRDKPVLLSAEYAASVPEALELDAFRLRQILLNLTSNAIKFTERGSVVLKVDWAADRLSIAVADTGSGLSPEGLARLFVAFQQADDKVASTHGGTGLGLTISRDLATLMQGEITVTSELAVGTVFTLRIAAPLAQLAAADALADPLNSASNSASSTGLNAAVGTSKSPPASAAGAGAAGASLGAAAGPAVPEVATLHGTVLLAEDTPDLRSLAVMYLKRLGLDVIEAVNGQEAVDLALLHRPDAILMDLEMPVLHGLEAVKQLRGRGFGGPILAMTAHTGDDQRALALAAGCNDMLSKPVSRTGLRTALDGVLSAQRRAS